MMIIPCMGEMDGMAVNGRMCVYMIMNDGSVQFRCILIMATDRDCSIVNNTNYVEFGSHAKIYTPLANLIISGGERRFPVSCYASQM